MFRKYYDDYYYKFNEEFDKTGLFWAFDMKQFDENKTHKDAPNTEYLTIGDGGYIHKSDKSKLDDFYKNTVPKLKEELKNKIKIDDLIEYELENRECYYIGDYTEVIFIIKDFYKELSIKEIHNKVKSIYDKHLLELEESNINI